MPWQCRVKHKHVVAAMAAAAGTDGARPDMVQVCSELVELSKQLEQEDDLGGKRVLLRCDLNVPTNKATGAVTDASRITAALPAIELLLSKGAKVSCPSDPAHSSRASINIINAAWYSTNRCKP